jgi:hypothetical protein
MRSKMKAAGIVRSHSSKFFTSFDYRAASWTVTLGFTVLAVDYWDAWPVELHVICDVPPI